MYMRSQLEKLTGIITGSDTPLSDPLSQSLQFQSAAGQQTVYDGVWIVDSKYPMRNSMNMDFKCNKIVLVVRDPFEVILDNAHTTLTLTNSEKADINLNSQWWG